MEKHVRIQTQSVLTWGATLTRTANRPAVGHRHRVTLEAGDHSSANRHACTSHWCSRPANLAAVAHVTFHVPLTGRGGSVRSNSSSVITVGQCLRNRRPSCATVTDTTGVITLYSTSLSPSLLRTTTREKLEKKCTNKKIPTPIVKDNN